MGSSSCWLTLATAARALALWAADFFAEDVRSVDDDAASATLDLDLLPPVDHRVGLLLLAAGEEARVLRPSDLVASGPKLAADLLAHHRRAVSDR